MLHCICVDLSNFSWLFEYLTEFCTCSVPYDEGTFTLSVHFCFARFTEMKY